MKICNKCKIDKDLDDFNNDNRALDKKSSICRMCKSDSAKEYRENNKEKIRLSKKIYRQKNTKKIAERDRIYRENNKEKIAKNKREYEKRNKTKIAKKSKQYQIEHKEEIAVKSKLYREKNKETLCKNQRTYRSNNKKIIAKNKKAYYQTPAGKISKKNSYSKRRFLKYSTNNGSLPMRYKYPLNSNLSSLMYKQGGKCNECGCSVDAYDNNTHLDHITPLSKGGTHTLDNVQWLCASCNTIKGDKVA